MTSPNYTLISKKSFYHDRILVKVMRDDLLDVYEIVIADTLQHPIDEISPYGVFLSEASALEKFNNIRL